MKFLSVLLMESQNRRQETNQEPRTTLEGYVENNNTDTDDRFQSLARIKRKPNNENPIIKRKIPQQES